MALYRLWLCVSLFLRLFAGVVAMPEAVLSFSDPSDDSEFCLVVAVPPAVSVGSCVGNVGDGLGVPGLFRSASGWISLAKFLCIN